MIVGDLFSLSFCFSFFCLFCPFSLRAASLSKLLLSSSFLQLLILRLALSTSFSFSLNLFTYPSRAYLSLSTNRLKTSLKLAEVVPREVSRRELNLCECYTYFCMTGCRSNIPMPSNVSLAQYQVSLTTMCLLQTRWEKLMAPLVRNTFSDRMAGGEPSIISPSSLSLSQIEMRQQACLLIRAICSRGAQMQEMYSLQQSRSGRGDPSIACLYADNYYCLSLQPKQSSQSYLIPEIPFPLPPWITTTPCVPHSWYFYPTANQTLMREQTLEQQLPYSKKMGSYRPHFEGKPDDYYQLECGEVSCAISVCFAIVIFFFFLCVAFFEWSARHSTSEMILVWSIILAVFIPAFMVAAYIGSNNKMEIEEKLIKEALKRILEQKKGKKGEREEREEKLQEMEVSMTINKINVDA